MLHTSFDVPTVPPCAFRPGLDYTRGTCSVSGVMRSLELEGFLRVKDVTAGALHAAPARRPCGFGEERGDDLIRLGHATVGWTSLFGGLHDCHVLAERGLGVPGGERPEQGRLVVAMRLVEYDELLGYGRFFLLDFHGFGGVDFRGTVAHAAPRVVVPSPLRCAS